MPLLFAKALAQRLGPLITKFAATTVGDFLIGEVEKAGGKAIFQKGASTIAKRIGARNVRKAIFSEGFTIADAATSTFDTTSWIVQRIATSEYAKYYNNVALRRLGMEGLGKGFSARRTALSLAKDQKILSFLENAKNPYALRKMVGTLYEPRTSKQSFARGIVKGAINQTAGTLLFNALHHNEPVSQGAWSTKAVQNLDELVLPASSAHTPFTRIELAVRMFDVATVRKNETFGTYSRIKRTEIVNGISAIPNHPVGIVSGTSAVLQNIFTPEGLGRLAGTYAARQAMLLSGQDERQRRLYSQGRGNRTSVNNSGEIWVDPYTKKDGTRVAGYYRSA